MPDTTPKPANNYLKLALPRDAVRDPALPEIVLFDDTDRDDTDRAVAEIRALAATYGVNPFASVSVWKWSIHVPHTATVICAEYE